jgi:hypothetical protein
VVFLSFGYFFISFRVVTIDALPTTKPIRGPATENTSAASSVEKVEEDGGRGRGRGRGTRGKGFVHYNSK